MDQDGGGLCKVGRASRWSDGGVVGARGCRRSALGFGPWLLRRLIRVPRPRGPAPGRRCQDVSAGRCLSALPTQLSVPRDRPSQRGPIDDPQRYPRPVVHVVSHREGPVADKPRQQPLRRDRRPPRATLHHPKQANHRAAAPRPHARPGARPRCQSPGTVETRFCLTGPCFVGDWGPKGTAVNLLPDDHGAGGWAGRGAAGPTSTPLPSARRPAPARSRRG